MNDRTEHPATRVGRAKHRLSPKEEVRARTSSRRKAGAETTMEMSPINALSPRSSAPVAPAGRASRSLSPRVEMRGQFVQPVGQPEFDTHFEHADGPSQPGDQLAPVTHGIAVAGALSRSGGERHHAVDTQADSALAAAIDEIREQWKRRQMWHRAEKSLTLQAKAMCRRLMQGDKKEAEVLYKSAMNGGEHGLAATAYLAMHPLLEARKGIEAARMAVEKRLLILAKGVLVAPWVDSVRGFGVLSLAGIIGEAGDLGGYSNPAKLWKRMGLAVIGGERQRKKEGAAGIEHGYNPARRSLMWTIGDCIIKAGGPLKDLYNERKTYEVPRVKTKMHAHNRAKRYIEKRLLRDLWRAWRDASVAVSPRPSLHPSDSPTSEAADATD